MTTFALLYFVNVRMNSAGLASVLQLALFYDQHVPSKLYHG
ncbi:MAG: hypothetical protein ABJP90_00160 [Paracoccaceae bacterium]